jgi:hypothetical protein
MAKRIHADRHLWADRFAAPDAQQLLGALPQDILPLVQSLRDTLRASAGLTESLRWCGLPWRWALTYTPGGAEVVAYLVPNPESPSIVFRLTHEQFTDLPTKRLSRFIRDGLAQSRLIAGVAWPEWSVQGPVQLKDLTDLFAMLRETELTRA